MTGRKSKIIFFIFLLYLTYPVSFKAQKIASFDPFNTRQFDTAINRDQIREANIVRNTLRKINKYTMPAFKLEFISFLQNDLMPDDSALCNTIINKIKSDSSFVSRCREFAEISKYRLNIKSNNFIFYSKSDIILSRKEVEFWEKENERLSAIFKPVLFNTINFVIDKEEKYGRAFPPWEIIYGIKQNELGRNTHELVHLMLFKYSDVPFFHEPLAFMFGTDSGNKAKMKERFDKYCKFILNDKFVSSIDLIHFPQIIGLDNTKWASAFCFIYKIVEKYGIDKLLQLMPLNLWKDKADNYLQSIEAVYGLTLPELEEEILKEIKSSEH